MTCIKCEDIIHSYNGKPFFPPEGSKHETFTCNCGQRWWRYNNYYGLWTTIDDDETWKNVKGGCKYPISIGTPAKNLPPGEYI